MAVALALVILGAVACLLATMKQSAPKVEPGILALAAFGLITLGAVIGFPIDEIKKANGANAAMADLLKDPSRQTANGMQNPIGIERTPWFWFELVALAIPAAIWLKRRLAQAPAPSATRVSPPS